MNNPNEAKKPREFWVESKELDETISRCDLGDFRMQSISCYPRKEILKHLSKFVEATPERDAEIETWKTRAVEDARLAESENYLKVNLQSKVKALEEKLAIAKECLNDFYKNYEFGKHFDEIVLETLSKLKEGGA